MRHGWCVFDFCCLFGLGGRSCACFLLILLALLLCRHSSLVRRLACPRRMRRFLLLLPQSGLHRALTILRGLARVADSLGFLQCRTLLLETRTIRGSLGRIGLRLLPRLRSSGLGDLVQPTLLLRLLCSLRLLLSHQLLALVSLLCSLGHTG